MTTPALPPAGRRAVAEGSRDQGEDDGQQRQFVPAPAPRSPGNMPPSRLVNKTKSRRALQFAGQANGAAAAPAPGELGEESSYTFDPNRHAQSRIQSAYQSFKGFAVEGLTGEQRRIRQRWLIDWIRELKDRLPPFTLEKIGITPDKEDVSDDEVEELLMQLPDHEAQRFQTMYSRTMAYVHTMASALDTAFIEQHTKNAIKRYQEHQQISIQEFNDRRTRAYQDKLKSKPWEYAIDQFSKRIDAATRIQRAFRRFRESCQLKGFYPSDENPQHWKHWVDFRAKHGWADEELVDAYGDPVQRTDGGRRVKGKKGQMPPHVKARYLESIGHVKGDRERAPSISRGSTMNMTKENQDALRSYEKAERLADIISNKWRRLQERAARRAKWFMEAEARRAAGLAIADSDMESDTDEEEDDKHLPPVERERRRHARYLSFITDPEVRRLVEFGVEPFLPSGIDISDLERLSNADMGDHASAMVARTHSTHMAALLHSFRLAHKYKQQLLEAKRQGLSVLPRPPMNFNPDVLKMYEDVMVGVVEAYQHDLEIALREGRTPPPPPEGVSQDTLDLYNDIMANIRRMETGYDTDDAEDDAPRVRRLTKYGQAWLQAMDQSAQSRRRLLRTRSQGNLGVQNAALYRPAGAPEPRFEKATGLTSTTSDCGTAGEINTKNNDNTHRDPQSGASQGSLQDGGCAEGVSDGPAGKRKGPKRNFTFKDLSVKHATTLQPLTASAAFKLHGSVESNGRRRTRPLVVLDTQAMDGVDWRGVATIPEGSEAPIAPLRLRPSRLKSARKIEDQEPASGRTMQRSTRSVRNRVLQTIAAEKQGFASIAATLMLKKTSEETPADQAEHAGHATADEPAPTSAGLEPVNEQTDTEADAGATSDAPTQSVRPGSSRDRKGVTRNGGLSEAEREEDDAEAEVAAIVAAQELTQRLRESPAHGVPLSTLRSVPLRSMNSQSSNASGHQHHVERSAPSTPLMGLREHGMGAAGQQRQDPRSLAHFFVAPPGAANGAVSVPTSMQRAGHHHLGATPSHHATSPVPEEDSSNLNSNSTQSVAAVASGVHSQPSQHSSQHTAESDGSIPLNDALALGLLRGGANNPNRNMALARLAVSLLRPSAPLPGTDGTQQAHNGLVSYYSQHADRPTSAVGSVDSNPRYGPGVGILTTVGENMPMYQSVFAGMTGHASPSPGESECGALGVGRGMGQHPPGVTAATVDINRYQGEVVAGERDAGVRAADGGVGVGGGAGKTLDALAGLVGGRAARTPRTPMSHLMGKVTRSEVAAALWRRAKAAVQRLLASYPPEVRDMMHQAGLAELPPTVLLERAMEMLRAPHRLQLEDCGEVVVVNKRPHSAGTTRDVDRAAAIAVAQQGAMQTTAQSQVSRLLGKSDLPDTAQSTHQRLAGVAMPAGGLAREAGHRSVIHRLTLRDEPGTGTGGATTDGERPNRVSVGWLETTRVWSQGGLTRDDSMAKRRSMSGSVGAVSRGSRASRVSRMSTTVNAAAAADAVEDDTAAATDPNAATTDNNASFDFLNQPNRNNNQSNQRPAVTGKAVGRNAAQNEETEEEEFMGSSPATGPFSFLGSVLADVFVEEHRLRKREEQLAHSLDPMFSRFRDPSRQGDSPGRGSRENALLEHYRRMYGGRRDRDKSPYSINRMNIQRISPDERKTMQQRYVQVFKSHEYRWLHQHLKLNTVPSAPYEPLPGPSEERVLAEASANFMDNSHADTHYRVSRATMRLRARRSQGIANDTPASNRSRSPPARSTRRSRSPSPHHDTDSHKRHTPQPQTDTDPTQTQTEGDEAAGPQGKAGEGAAMQVEDSNTSSNSYSNLSGGPSGTAPGKLRVTSDMFPLSPVKDLSTDWLRRGHTLHGAGHMSVWDRGPCVFSLPHGEGQTSLTVEPQDWDWLGAEGAAAPAWLVRLMARTSLANKLGLTTGYMQRQRFQHAAALHQRTMGTPTDMHNAVTVHQPLPPGPIDPSNPLLGTLPSAYTRPVGGSAALHVDSYGATGTPGVVSAPSVPVSDLSPSRRTGSPVRMHEPMHPTQPSQQPINDPAVQYTVSPRDSSTRLSWINQRPLAGVQSPMHGLHGAPTPYQGLHGSPRESQVVHGCASPHGAYSPQRAALRAEDQRMRDACQSAPSGLLAQDAWGAASPQGRGGRLVAATRATSPRVAVNAISSPPSRAGRLGAGSPQTALPGAGLVLATTPTMVKPKRVLPMLVVPPSP